MIIRFTKEDKNAKAPTRGSEAAAGYDLYADILEAATIMPGETVFISTGISVEIPDGYFGAVFARSGLACKAGLRPANCVGVIDSDYRGEIKVALHNDSEFVRVVRRDERVAQLVILPYEQVEFEEVYTLNETMRGGGGFGSTGEQ